MAAPVEFRRTSFDGAIVLLLGGGAALTARALLAHEDIVVRGRTIPFPIALALMVFGVAVSGFSLHRLLSRRPWLRLCDDWIEIRQLPRMLRIRWTEIESIHEPSIPKRHGSLAHIKITTRGGRQLSLSSHSADQVKEIYESLIRCWSRPD